MPSGPAGTRSRPALTPLAACAALVLGTGTLATRSPAQTTKDRVLLVDSDGNVFHTNDAGTAVEANVRASLASVMTALAPAYKEAGIPVRTLDSDHGTIGNSSYRVPTHYLGGKRLSTILDCGTQPMVGERADLYDVWISVLTTARPTSDSVTVISTAVDGQARPVGEAGGTVHCASTGALEQTIGDAMAKRLAD